MICGRGETGRRSRLKICLPFGNAGSSPAVRTISGVMILTQLAACGSVGHRLPRDPHILVRLADTEAKGLDPQSYSDLSSTRIAAEQFEGLTRFDAAGKAEPALAQSWSQSNDGLVWIFSLKPKLKFSDAAAIDANVFARVFARLHAPATASPQTELFEAIRSVRAVSETSVEVRLNHPFPALPELLAHPALAALPLHRANWAHDRPLVTSGAYRTKTWVLNDHLLLEANPFWHGGRPNIATIEWRPVSDNLVALRLFQAGGADILGDIPSTRLAALRTASPDQVHVAPYSGSYYFAFNTRKPPFNDPRVRQALSLAVERGWLTNQLLGTGVLPAWGVVPPGTTGLGAYKPIWAGWDRKRRMGAAAHLLNAAGYGPQHPLSFEIRFNSDTDHRRISVALAAMWKPLGVDAKLLNSEASLHFASLRRADFALARSGWIGDIPVPENYLSVHVGAAGPTNYSGFANADFDRRLADALNIPSPALRAAKMREAEIILMEQAPILPLYHYVSKVMISPQVAGWQDNAANIHPSRTLSFR
jgi:oligopeptide transport system substrate-binding protein